MYRCHRYKFIHPHGSPLTPCANCPQAIGTRGDIQPFIALGLRLREAGYRVRLASHAAFRSFVADAGLEFYPLGGDPITLARCAAQTGGEPHMQSNSCPAAEAASSLFHMHDESTACSAVIFRYAGIFPPRNFKAVDELRRQVGQRSQLPACTYTEGALHAKRLPVMAAQHRGPTVQRRLGCTWSISWMPAASRTPRLLARRRSRYA
jgi:Glycosyltransferase family 28 N-terminal domain